jgi:hypothetical protein
MYTTSDFESTVYASTQPSASQVRGIADFSKVTINEAPRGNLLKVILIFAVALILPTAGRAAPKRVPKAAADTAVGPSCNADLELAKKFAELGDWKDAESQFSAAAKDETCRKQAWSGIETARHHREANVLQTGQIYESEHEWLKAEDLYRSAAADPSTGNATRSIVGDRLRSVLKAQAREKRWSEWSDTVKKVSAAVVFFFGLVLLFATVRSIWKSRQTILIYPFAAPTNELATVLNMQLRYARVTMQDPALSPAGQVPAPLVENLFTFSEEVEPIDDLEIAGSKIPFASLGKLFGRPNVRVTGGFDGVAPIGNAYSIVQTHDASATTFIRREIRVGVPNVQRLDLLDFAYDVMVKASSAYEPI